MAISNYRFDGDKRQGYHTSSVSTDDAYGNPRIVWNSKFYANTTSTPTQIDLTDTQVSSLRTNYVFTSSTYAPPPPPPPVTITPDYYQPKFEKGKPGGYTPLDENTKVPSSYLPAGSGGTIVETDPVATAALNSHSGDQTAHNIPNQLSAKADKDSPALTGFPTSPTPTTGDNSTRIATTAFVNSSVGTGGGTGGGTGTVSDATTSSKGVVQLAGDLAGTASSPSVPALQAKADKASPSLTGTPTAPTPASGNNTTQLATTAYVQANSARLSHTHPINDVVATGTPSFSTYLRGDGTWSSIPAAGLPTVGTDLGTIAGSTTTVSMSDQIPNWSAVLTAGVESPITVSNITKDRMAIFLIVQATNTANPGSIKINGTSVATDPTTDSLTVVKAYGRSDQSLYFESTASDATPTTTQTTRIRTLSASGSPLTVGNTKDWIGIPVNETILGISAFSDGTDVIADVNVAPGPSDLVGAGSAEVGTSLFTTQSLRPNPKGANSYFASERVPDTTLLSSGQILVLDIAALGGVGGDFIAAGASATASAGTVFNIAYPVPVTAGDLLITHISLTGAQAMTITTPSGWSLGGTSEYSTSTTTAWQVWQFYKIATGTETGSLGFTTASGGNGAATAKSGQMLSFSNPVSTATRDQFVTSFDGPSTSHTLPAGPATTATNTLRVASIKLSTSTISSPPTGMTQPASIGTFVRKLSSTGVPTGEAFTTAASAGAAMVVAEYKIASSSTPSSTRVQVYVRTQER